MYFSLTKLFMIPLYSVFQNMVKQYKRLFKEANLKRLDFFPQFPIHDLFSSRNLTLEGSLFLIL